MSSSQVPLSRRLSRGGTRTTGEDYLAWASLYPRVLRICSESSVYDVLNRILAKYRGQKYRAEFSAAEGGGLIAQGAGGLRRKLSMTPPDPLF